MGHCGAIGSWKTIAIRAPRTPVELADGATQELGITQTATLPGCTAIIRQYAQPAWNGWLCLPLPDSPTMLHAFARPHIDVNVAVHGAHDPICD